jgi:chitodextrinase
MTSEWKSDVTYNTGDIVTYQGNTYKCITGHTSQAGWLPTVVAALWQPCAAPVAEVVVEEVA